MNEKEQIQDEIDRFLNYEMNREEEDDFIGRMKKDDALREKVLFCQLMIEAERKKREAEFIGQAVRTPRRKVFIRRYGWIAACLCILLGGLFFYGRMYRFSTQEVLQTVYVPPVWEASRSEGFLTPEHARINRRIEQWYLDGETDSLVVCYRNLSADGGLTCMTGKSRMYMGTAFLQQGDVRTAYWLANELVAGPEKEVGEWLMLGCLLYDGKRQEALELASRIGERNNVYREEAEKIQNALKCRRWF